MSIINETWDDGKSYRVKRKDGGWLKKSFLHRAKDLLFGDGNDLTNNAENNLGAIKGLTKSTNVTEEGYVVDATVINEINSNLEPYIQYWIENGYLPDPNSELLYLYKNGNPCTAVTGGWEATSLYHYGYNNPATGAPGLNMAGTSMIITRNSNPSNVSGSVWTVKAINLTGKNTMHIKCKNTAAQSGIELGFTKTKGNAFDTSHTISMYNISPFNGTYTLDISSLSGDYYFVADVNNMRGGDTFTIYDIWLE